MHEVRHLAREAGRRSVARASSPVDMGNMPMPPFDRDKTSKPLERIENEFKLAINLAHCALAAIDHTMTPAVGCHGASGRLLAPCCCAHELPEHRRILKVRDVWVFETIFRYRKPTSIGIDNLQFGRGTAWSSKQPLLHGTRQSGPPRRRKQMKNFGDTLLNQQSHKSPVLYKPRDLEIWRIYETFLFWARLRFARSRFTAHARGARIPAVTRP